MPIDPLISRPASQDAAMAASSQMITTGTDRVLKRGEIAQEVDLANESRKPFLNKLIELFNITPEVVPNVATKTQRKPHEEESIYYERIRKAISNKVAENVKKKEKNSQGKEKEKEEKEKDNELSTPEKLRTTDTTLIKDYIILKAKDILNIPEEEQSMVKAKLSFMESELKNQGYSDADFAYLYGKVQTFLAGELSSIIKDVFMKKLSSPIEVAELILHGKKAADLAGFAFYSRNIDKFIQNIRSTDMPSDTESRIGLSGIPLTFGVSDLIEIIGEMRIDLKSIIARWSGSDIKLSSDKELEIEFIRQKEQDISKFVDEYRNTLVEKFLEENFFKISAKNIQIRNLEKKLLDFGIDKKELEENKSLAKKLAWVRQIALLKETHLQRIFTTSWQDFDKYSTKIIKLTKSIRDLGQGIPAEGLKWVESEIETLAIQSATYKLNLLRTIQELEYDVKREKDITHLSKVLLHMWNKKLGKSADFKKRNSFIIRNRIRIRRFFRVLGIR